MPKVFETPIVEFDDQFSEIKEFDKIPPKNRLCYRKLKLQNFLSGTFGSKNMEFGTVFA